MRVELVYDAACSQVRAARLVLLQAFARAKRAPRWIEWESHASETPDHARGHASPTILVDGIGEGEPGAAPACRLYTSAGGRLAGVPDVAQLAARLRVEGRGSTERGRFGALLAAAPAGGAFLLPVGACPACWPAYATVLGSVGLGFLVTERVLLPIAGLLLGIALLRLVQRARLQRRRGPLLSGLAGAALLVAARIADAPAASLAGAGLLIVAALWDGWPPRRSTPCPACGPSPSETTQPEESP